MNTILFVGEHPKTFDVRWHTHDHWELIYCTGGQGAFRFLDGSEISYHTNEFVLIPPKVVHSNSSDEGFTNIHMTMAEPSFPYKTPFRLADPEGSVRMAFEQVKTYYLTDVNKKDLVLTALGDLIASYVVVLRSNSEFSEPVERIRRSIIQNYTRSDYELDSFIHKLPFHYDYLRKLFKKEVGVSPLEYMTTMRMRRAEKLMTSMWSSGYTISEIAQMCGYEDSLYFSRVFKKYYGCSPSNFSKQQRLTHVKDPGRTELDSEENATENRIHTAD